MPLQKLPPHGPAIVSSQATNRRQIQERRRTLQTISELSTVEMTPPDFRKINGSGRMAVAGQFGASAGNKKDSNFKKRRSLPQNYARPGCAQASPPPPVPSRHIAFAQRSQPDNGTQPIRSLQPESGWNARRERARLQAEEALSGVSVRSQQSSSSINVAALSSQPGNSPLPRTKSSQPHLRSHHSHQQSLRNSRSMTRTPISPESRPNLRASPSQNTIRDYAPSDLASTDSSSFLSSPNNSIRRSRSSSSSQSFTLQGVPPLPTGCAQPTQSYYTTITSPYHCGYPVQLPGPMYAKAPSEIRTSSFPSMQLQSNILPPTYHAIMSPAMYTNEQHNHAQQVRPKSLTASSHRHSMDRHTSRSSVTSQHSRTTSQRKQHPPPAPHPHPLPLPSSKQPRTRSRSRSRSRSQSRSRTTSTSHARSPQSQTQLPPNAHISPLSSHPPKQHRSIPTREALLKWKSEREEAKAEFDGIQRAKMKERVRRANEMELQKERELQALGKGAEKGARVLGVGLDEKGGGGYGKGKGKGARGGCFGGVFGRLMGKLGGR
ncbi:hypothetical protein BKA63DRAFT_595370 [Paraphoma chrysanthemicola]|nr:hypothetical protein BKA63DRAFT_595370 [Paraphoma chrysanthemicola]